MRGSSAADVLGRPFRLPASGVELGNRFLKSAMSEILGAPDHGPTARHERLYRRWAEGRVGVAVTGNVMIDSRALGEPGNVVVEDERHLAALRRWARAGSVGGTQVWMQLNHPGKQSPRFLSPTTVAPSAVPFSDDLQQAFATPRPLAEDEILDLVARFGRTAAVARAAGFGGVQIHGAHGYLVSQFLSPHHNRRTDRWGGSLENRARFALEVYRSVRAAVGSDYPVSIKINSADFQRGGFEENDSLEVIGALVDEGVDLVEISGGNYENPVLTGRGVAASTRAREAYFLAFAERVREAIDVPLALTGGFRSAGGMAGAVERGAIDLVGLARPLAIEPDLPARILAGEDAVSRCGRLTSGVRWLDRLSMLDITWYETQLARMGDGLSPIPGLPPWRSIALCLGRMGIQAFRERRATGT